MLALQLRRAGHTVVLFEAGDRLGGAWRIEEVEGIGSVECACHLLEWYAGGYAALARFSGCEFVASDPQPARVYSDGRIAPYLTRRTIAHSLYLELRSLAAAVVRLFLARREDRREKAALLAFRWRMLTFFLRYRLPGIAMFDAVRRPAQGYSAFLEDLCRQVAASGVRVLTDRVEALDVRGDHAELRHGGKQTRVKRVYLGESTEIEGHVAEGEAVVRPQDYHHAVVSVLASEVVLRSDYVHTPDDPIFHRITYVRDYIPEGALPRSVFLVQLRIRPDEIVDLGGNLMRLFERCGITNGQATNVVHKLFSQKYMQRRVGAPRAYRRDGVVRHFRTLGDLARSVVIEARALDRVEG